jgi:hypothetical protein
MLLYTVTKEIVGVFVRFVRRFTQQVSAETDNGNNTKTRRRHKHNEGTRRPVRNIPCFT